mmetsp:Transcript_44437/g.134700  ORF Transcript_44437/g.134700 Transcript_44437/m.134700 type:complete len:200 (+) Transcript_44437:740-1339(+)
MCVPYFSKRRAMAPLHASPGVGHAGARKSPRPHVACKSRRSSASWSDGFMYALSTCKRNLGTVSRRVLMKKLVVLSVPRSSLRVSRWLFESECSCSNPADPPKPPQLPPADTPTLKAFADELPKELMIFSAWLAAATLVNDQLSSVSTRLDFVSIAFLTGSKSLAYSPVRWATISANRSSGRVLLRTTPRKMPSRSNKS